MNRTTDYDRYETPEVLVTDQTLSATQKLARLEAWEEDLKAGLRASDESMTSIKPGLSGALLQRVMACLERWSTDPPQTYALWGDERKILQAILGFFAAPRWCRARAKTPCQATSSTGITAHAGGGAGSDTGTAPTGRHFPLTLRQ